LPSAFRAEAISPEQDEQRVHDHPAARPAEHAAAQVVSGRNRTVAGTDARDYHGRMTAFEVVLFPFGNAEGFPSLRLTPEATQGLAVEDLAVQLEPFWAANCWGIWLDGFTWDKRTAEIVDALANDDRWSRRHVVATMEVARPETAIQRCTLVADASSALADAHDDASALAIIERMHPFEGIRDLVVSPRFAAGPNVLDRLHAAVGPTGGGTVYASRGAPWAESLRRSVIQARSPWAMRYRQEIATP
jgi:hypothetical protein